MTTELSRRLPALEAFEADYFRSNRILPLEITDGRLRLAAAGDPASTVLDEIEVVTGLPVELVPVTREQLEDCIRRASTPERRCPPRTYARAPDADVAEPAPEVLLQTVDGDGIQIAATWLARPENFRWLDFGAGTQVLTAEHLRVMVAQDTHHLRFYGVEHAPRIGIVALSEVSRAFRTGTLWYVLGDKRFARQGYTCAAVARLLDEAFGELSLKSVYAWACDGNAASIAVLRRNGFKPAGRRRACHVIAGKWHDRLNFDLVASEYRSRSPSSLADRLVKVFRFARAPSGHRRGSPAAPRDQTSLPPKASGRR
jgi:RimJ/RimL family protein N-acetyltransferase